MAVQVIPGLKRKVGADAHRQRANHRIADVEVIMQVARGNTPNDAVVRIIGGKLRHPRLEGAAHLHAGEDAVDTVLIAPLHPFEMSQDALLLAHTSLSLQYGDFVVAGVSLYPSSIFGSSLRQHLRRNWILTMQVAEKMHNVFGTGEQGHIPLDDDAIETVIYKNQETCKKLRKVSIGRLLGSSGRTTKIIRPGDRWNQPHHTFCVAILSSDFKGAALGYT